jgi:hypothetical protein
VICDFGHIRFRLEKHPLKPAAGHAIVPDQPKTAVLHAENALISGKER